MKGENMVYYFWYDHMVLRNTGEAEIVKEAIKAHDFDTFCKIKEKYPDTEDICYFPPYAFDDNGEKVDITTPEGFCKIEGSEYECG